MKISNAIFVFSLILITADGNENHVSTSLVRPPRPPICPAVLCEPLFCPNPIKRTCCDVCLEDCRVVRCATPPCSNPVTPPGRCCPVCPPTQPIPRDCSRIQCFPPDCPNPKPPNPGECCPFCLESCAVVSCVLPMCPNSFVPPGRCCPICPPTFPPPTLPTLPPRPPPLDCRVVRCRAPSCPNPIPPPPGGCCSTCSEDCTGLACSPPNCRNFFTPPGRCCPICPPTDCSAVLCLAPTCPNPTPPPPGQCCSTCEVLEPNVCSLPSDPGPCRASFPRWFYNSRTQKCERFTYGGCRGNGNRFDDLRSCVEQCGNSCPPNTPVAACLADPCSVTRCAAFPNAICISNFCGGCNARFFIESSGREVTSICEKKETCAITGQTFTSCGGICNPTCENPRPTSCLLRRACSSGCACPQGTLLDRRVSACVNSDNCGNCPANKFPFNCRVNPCFTTSCSNHPNAECLLDICGGCFARFFIGNKEVTDQCILTGSVCPIKGQFVQDCASFCPATCNNLDLVCIQVCRRGCGCPPGEVIDEANNRCVPRNQCPIPQCPIKGQTFQRCKPCLVTCETVGQLRPCPFICEQGCGCPFGTVLDEKQNMCVREEQCTPKVDCSSAICEPVHCGNPILPHASRGQCCPTCPPGSRCSVKGQIYQQCRSCPATCSEPNKICTADCRPGCGCPVGQVIDENQNKCVPRSSCPKTTNELCSLPRKRGYCRGFYFRYYYSARFGRCVGFIYGGCGGNKNNFRSIYACKRSCH